MKPSPQQERVETALCGLGSGAFSTAARHRAATVLTQDIPLRWTLAIAPRSEGLQLGPPHLPKILWATRE